MHRSLAAVAACCLAALTGCRTVSREPPLAGPAVAPPMIGATGSWQPGYLAAYPVNSSYRLVSLSPEPARLRPVPSAAPLPPPPPAKRARPARQSVATARPRPAAKPAEAPAPSPKPAPKPAAKPERKSATATAYGAHAPDYSWLVGRLEHDALGDRMYLRYGDDTTDRHGGVLELIGVKVSRGLVPGQTVRVEGQRVTSPDGPEMAYRAATIQQVALGLVREAVPAGKEK